MLRKEHLRYTVRGGNVKANLISEKGAWPKRLQSYLESLELSLPLPYRDCQDFGKIFQAKHPRSKRLLMGLLSILDKGMEKEEVLEEEFSQRRTRAFDEKVKELRSIPEQPCFPEKFEKLVLYGDLESEREIRSIKLKRGLEWVRRYNMELVQGLVRMGDRVQIDWPMVSPERWKFLCRQLKFWGLLFQSSDLKERGGKSLVIEGPLSQFGGHQTYRDRIGALVGVLPQIEPFTLKVDLRIENRRVFFEINQEAGLRSSNRNFFDHETDSWRLLRKELLENLGSEWGWEEDDVPEGDWKGWAVADAVLVSPAGEKVSIHHFLRHQTNTLVKVHEHLSKGHIQQRRLWLLEKPLDEKIEITSTDRVFSYRSLPSGKRLASVLKKMQGQLP
jgi:predicted nuclease of restriction endonuclease-like RecB superfamily